MELINVALYSGRGFLNVKSPQVFLLGESVCCYLCKGRGACLGTCTLTWWIMTPIGISPEPPTEVRSCWICRFTVMMLSQNHAANMGIWYFDTLSHWFLQHNQIYLLFNQNHKEIEIWEKQHMSRSDNVQCSIPLNTADGYCYPPLSSPYYIL